MNFDRNVKPTKLYARGERGLGCEGDDQRLKKELMDVIDNCLPSLDKLIDEYHVTGKVPIDGYYFDSRYAKNLSNLMHDIRNGTDSDYRRAADFINLQLIVASDCWRKVFAKLEEIA